MESNFDEIKQEILRRAKAASACKHEYGRAYTAENLYELSQVIKDNFNWVCSHDVLTVDLVEKYKEDFAANDIYANQNAESGYILCSNATVKARGNATVAACGNTMVESFDSTKVEAYDNATVEAYRYATVTAYGNATVRAYGSSTVKACDNAKVRACDGAYCTSPYTIDCKLFDHAIYRVQDTNTVYYADSDVKFVKQ